MPARRSKTRRASAPLTPFELLGQLRPRWAVCNNDDLRRLIARQEIELDALRQILAVCEGRGPKESDEPAPDPSPREEAGKNIAGKKIGESHLSAPDVFSETPETKPANYETPRPKRETPAPIGETPRRKSWGWTGEHAKQETALERECRLATAAQAGDGNARDLLLVAAEISLRRMALKMGQSCRIESTDDLLQEGRLGYSQAIDRYDVERGLRLSTFALRRAAGAMKDYLRVMGYFLTGGQRSHPGRPARQERVGLLPAPARGDSFVPGPEEPAGDCGSADERRQIEGLDEFEGILARANVGTKDIRLSTMLRQRFIDGRSMEEIGAAIGVSASRVSRMLSDLLRRLREQIDPTGGELRRPAHAPTLPEFEGLPTLSPAMLDVMESGRNPKPELAQIGLTQIEHCKSKLRERHSEEQQARNPKIRPGTRGLRSRQTGT